MNRQHFGALESMRGIAALLVAILHAWWLNPIGELGLIRHAYIAVDFFFVLSGFVICHAYADRISDGAGFADFIWRRLGRLYPLHLAMLLVWVGLESIRHFMGASANPAFSAGDFLANLFLVHALTGTSFNAPSWSISAEFFVYVAFALVVLTTRRRLMVFLSIAMAGLVGMIWIGETDLHRTEVGVLRAAFGFFLGAAAYTVFPKINGAGLLGVMTLILIAIFPHSRLDFFMPFLFCALIVAMAQHPVGVLNSKPLRWLGEISYSIYMVHFAVAWMFKQALVYGLGFKNDAAADMVNTNAVTGTVALLAYVVAVLAFSHLTYRWIEKPWRERSRAWLTEAHRKTSQSLQPHQHSQLKP